MTWLAMTLVIVLISYIWMNPDAPPNPTESAGMLSPEDSTDTLIRTASIIKRETMAITKDSDDSRAREFLVAEQSGKPH